MQKLCENEESQICMLRQVYELWQQHPQFLGVVVDKMLKTQIIECCAVANWIFSRDMAPEFTRSYIWEILHLTIRKMNKHVIRLEKELNDARTQLRSAPTESESSEDEQNQGLHSYFISNLLLNLFIGGSLVQHQYSDRKTIDVIL